MTSAIARTDREALEAAWDERSRLMDQTEAFATLADFAAGFDAGAAHARQLGEPVAERITAARGAALPPEQAG